MAGIREIIESLHDRGVHLARDGDRLRVINADRLTDADRYKLRSHKPAILEALQSRDALVMTASRDTGRDLSGWLEVEPLPSRDQLAAYALTLRTSEAMRSGQVPAHYTHRATCRHCGPVWLPVPGEAWGCPWCVVRAAGGAVPSC